MLGPRRFRKEASRHFYVTPTSYLQLLDSFRVLLTRKQADALTVQRRYEVGLEKLASTESQVGVLGAYRGFGGGAVGFRGGSGFGEH